MEHQISQNEAKEILTQDIKHTLNTIKQSNKIRPNKEVTYSKNVFLPITHICQNNCGYCTFKQEIKQADYILMEENEVLSKIKQAKKLGCKEALFTFGQSPDQNQEVQRKLEKEGYDDMADYTYHLAKTALNKYNILPHTNMGIITRKQLKQLSQVNASMGLMLETTNKKLLKTIAHKNSPTKDPQKRLKFIKTAGQEKIPFTTGLLVGIGETTQDHIDSLFEIRKIQDKYSHIQEIIIQGFKAKKDTPMKDHPEPPVTTLMKLTILTRLIFPDVSIQIPANLNNNLIQEFVTCGADDVGGISPITKDYINPEYTWPEIGQLKENLKNIGYTLKERLPVYDKYINKEYLDENVYNKAIQLKKELDK